MVYVIAIAAVAAAIFAIVKFIPPGGGGSRGRGVRGGSTDEEMKQLAVQARVEAKKEYRLDLTHDRASVKDMEETILRDLHNNQLIAPYPEEELAELSRLWGAYLGETLRRIRPGVWRARSRHEGRRPMPFVLDRDHEVFPCSWVYRRIKHGSDYGVHAKACEFADNRDNPRFALKGAE